MSKEKIHYEKLNITKKFSDGRMSTIPGHEDYRVVRDIFNNYSTGLESFGICPNFFEMYNDGDDSGFVVDVTKREIRVSESRYEKLCENAILECKNSGLEFKLKK